VFLLKETKSTFNFMDVIHKIEVIFQDCNTPTPYKLAEDVWAFPASAGRAVALSARPASPSVQPRLFAIAESEPYGHPSLTHPKISKFTAKEVWLELFLWLHSSPFHCCMDGNRLSV
jgi:hypothetical protein